MVLRPCCAVANRGAHVSVCENLDIPTYYGCIISEHIPSMHISAQFIIAKNHIPQTALMILLCVLVISLRVLVPWQRTLYYRIESQR
jgi:hypothetical protein